MFFFVKVAEASERKYPQSSEVAPEPQLYALIPWCLNTIWGLLSTVGPRTAVVQGDPLKSPPLNF